MKYESWFTLPLVIMLQCAIFADNLYKNLVLFFMKNVLRKRDYFIGHKFPYVMKDMEPRLSKELENDFTGYETGLVEVGPEKVILPAAFRDVADEVYSIKTRKNDTWIVTFPRSGTTWTQEMIWLVANNANLEYAKFYPLIRRFPFLDLSWFMTNKQMNSEIWNSIKYSPWKVFYFLSSNLPLVKFLKYWAYPRFIKTHLPMSFLPKDIFENGAKVVYVARNPKDVLVSYFHLNKMWRSIQYTNDFETFFDYFQKDQVYWSPYWSHVKEAWNLRHNPNVLFIFFEEMKNDLVGTIGRVSKFLGKPVKEEDLPKIIDHLSIENFKNNSSVNLWQGHEIGYFVPYNNAGFINKGKVGGSKNMFTDELSQKIEKWIEENLKDSDLKFPK